MRALAVTARDASVGVVEVAEPVPAAGEVGVAVEAASINGFDLSVAAGRVWDFMPHAFPVVLGRDFAGTVDAVGPEVEGVTVGDRVAGVLTALELGPGPIAERIVVDASAVTTVPGSVTAAQAAAVGLAGITALDAVAALDLSADDIVLVSGATGGVGVFAIQLAAATGARVIATARPGEAAEFVIGLGAGAAVDYTGDLSVAVQEVAPQGVTKVVHAAGDPATVGRPLVAGGLFASVVGATAEQLGRDDVTVTGVMGAFTPKKLGDLLDQVAKGRLVVPVQATHPLAAAEAALDDFADGKLGKIVVTVP